MSSAGEVHGIRSGRHDRICEAVIYGLRHDNYIPRSFFRDSKTLKRMLDKGLITKISDKLYQLNIEEVKAASYVVPDALWEKLGDIDYQRKLRGLDPQAINQKQERQHKRRAEQRKVRKANRGKKPYENDSFKLSEIMLGGKVEKDSI